MCLAWLGGMCLGAPRLAGASPRSPFPLHQGVQAPDGGCTLSLERCCGAGPQVTHWTCSMEKKYTIGVSSHWNLGAACCCSITQSVLTEAMCKGPRIMLALDQSLPKQQCYAGRPGVAQTGFHGDQDPGGVATLRHVVVSFAGWSAHLAVYPGQAF